MACEKHGSTVNPMGKTQSELTATRYASETAWARREQQVTL